MIAERDISKYKDYFFTNDETCRGVLQMLSLMSNKIRLQILCLLCEDDFCVNEIVSIVGGKFSNVSQQLKLLALAGLLTSEKNSKNVSYSLKNQNVKKTIQYLRRMFKYLRSPDTGEWDGLSRAKQGVGRHERV